MTVGHSTHTLEEFIALLQAHHIEELVDVRTVPRSRHNPQFNRESLPPELNRAGIGYLHMKELGGLRHARPDSPNTGWQNLSFRGYADHMQTCEFRDGLIAITELASRKRPAIMCAEAVPWSCHRSLIADALLVRGIPVEHILSPTRSQSHKLTPFARVDGDQLTYPGKD